MISRRLQWAVLLGLLAPSGAWAQSETPAVGANSPPPLQGRQGKWLDDPATAVALASRIVVGGAPGTYQIVSVPVPDGVPRSGGGHVEIVPRKGFTILGQHDWSLQALEGKTSIVGIIGISAGAHAGTVTAADVNFHVAGSPTVTVAIEMNISLVRGLAIRMRAGPLHGRAGSQVAFSYDLVNSGNSTESVVTSVESPPGWKANQRAGTAATIEPGASIARQVAVSIPRKVGSGSFFMRLSVLEKGVTRSTLPVRVEILDGLSPDGSSGPLITIAVASAIDASARRSTNSAVSIQGPLFDLVRIEAAFSVGENAPGSYMQALSGVGSYRSSPSLALSSPSGRLGLGAAGNSFSDLTGLYASGRGATLEAHRQGWRVIALGAKTSTSPSQTKPRPLLGVRADVDLGALSIMSSFTHLRSGEKSVRQLDAMSVGGTLDAGFNTKIGGEVAHRRFAGGSGTGWSTEVTRDDSRNSVRLRVTHAPGGSAAFARALNEVLGSFTQSLSRRLRLSGRAWRLSDVTSVFSQLSSSGWAIGPQYRIHHSTNVSVTAHSTTFSAITAPGQYGTGGGYAGSERQVGASVSTSVGHLTARGSVSAGTRSRTVGGTSAAQTGHTSPRISWNSMASWRRATSAFELQGRMDETRDLSGAVRRQSTISLRGNHALANLPGHGATADWELQQTRGFSVAPATVVRVGLTVPVNEMLAVRLYAERNPLFANAARSPWVYALRVERSVRLPMVRPPGTSGYVYNDLNGNLKRDAGEPGVDGAMVTRGGETAVTDANGKYRLAGDARTKIVLDETSLPLGWVRQSTGSADIPVGANLSAQIRFIVAPRSSIEAVEIDLSGIRATARDASGREWVARMTAPLVATFEALPPGTYTLELDVSAVTEPLVPRLPLPVLHVSAAEPSFVTVVLDPRPLKMWIATSSSTK